MNALSWAISIWFGLIFAVPSLWILACYLWPNGEGRHRKEAR